MYGDRDVGELRTVVSHMHLVLGVESGAVVRKLNDAAGVVPYRSIVLYHIVFRLAPRRLNGGAFIIFTPNRML